MLERNPGGRKAGITCNLARFLDQLLTTYVTLEKTLLLSCPQSHPYKEVIGQGDPSVFKPHNHLMFLSPQFSDPEP